MQKNQYDAIIIGARVAGAATALLLARAGASVLLVDRAHEIGDTLSTHALMRSAVHLLWQWDVLDPIAASTPPVTNTRFVYGKDTLDIPIKPNSSYPGLYAPRRWLLDNVLGAAAQNAGVDLRTGITCSGLIRAPDGRVKGAVLTDRQGNATEVRADIVIGADGRDSAVAKMVGARTLVRCNKRSAVVYAYANGISNEGYRWFYDDGIAAGLIPTSRDQHCIFISCRREELFAHMQADFAHGMRTMLGHWVPDIAEGLARDGFSEKPRRFLGAPGHLRRCAGPGWALVGDAGYFKDPLTAHGITDALRDAQLLLDASLCSGFRDLSSYQKTRDRLSAGFLRITGQIASFDWTLDQLKGLHKSLTATMKAEYAYLLEGVPAQQQAA